MHGREINKIASMIYDAPLGEYVGRDGAAILAQHAGSECRLQDNEFLYRRGEVTGSFYFVTEGRLALVREKTQEHNEIIVHVLEKGDIVGELSFIDQTPHTLSVRALGEASVLCFKADDINPLITEQPRLIFNFMRAVIKRAHRVVTTIGEHERELQNYISSGGKGRA